MLDNYPMLSGTSIRFPNSLAFPEHHDPFRGFHEHLSSGRQPATGCSDRFGKRYGSREVIIPIHVEGRDEPVFPVTNVYHHIDLTNENSNNSGLHSHSRSRRRHQTSSQLRHNTNGGKTTSCGVSNFQLSQNTQAERPLASSGHEGNCDKLLDELIDLCMYEDMLDTESPDCYIAESSEDTLKCSAKVKPDVHSSDCLITDPTSQSSCRAALSKRVTPTPSYAIYSLLKSQLAKDGRLIDYIRGDGNCFFRALSKDIYGSEEFHQEVRQAVVDLIEKYSKEFEQFLDSGMTISEHIRDMRRDATWATSAEIYAAATLLQRDIYVLSPDHTGEAYHWMLFRPRFVYTQDTSYHPCFITLCHTHGNHYDRITSKDGNCNCDQDPPVLSGVQAYVDLTK